MTDEKQKPSRVIVIEITADTDGNKGKHYYKIENGTKSEIKYKSITSDEKHKLLKTMGLLE